MAGNIILPRGHLFFFLSFCTATDSSCYLILVSPKRFCYRRFKEKKKKDYMEAEKEKDVMEIKVLKS